MTIQICKIILHKKEGIVYFYNLKNGQYFYKTTPNLLKKSVSFFKLARKFGHALDAFLSKRNKTHKVFFSESFIDGIKGYRIYVNDRRYALQSIKDHQMLEQYFHLMNSIIYKNADGKKNINTSYAENACKADAAQKKQYWSDPTEVFARAFETWVSDQLKMKGQINEYLVYGTDQPPASWNTRLNMYPEKMERDSIVAGMDHWVKSLVEIWKPIKK